MYKFGIAIDNSDKLYSPDNGLPFQDFAMLLTKMQKALGTDNPALCVSAITHGSYKIEFSSNQQSDSDKFEEIHKRVATEECELLPDNEREYATFIDKLITKRQVFFKPYTEKWQGSITEISKVKEKDFYYLQDQIQGVIREISAAEENKKGHIKLKNFSYRIFITELQDEVLKKFYKSSPLLFTLRQRIHIHKDSIIDATLLSFVDTEKGLFTDKIDRLIENEGDLFPMVLNGQQAKIQFFP